MPIIALSYNNEAENVSVLQDGIDKERFLLNIK
jgi:hypothetical protein